MNAAAPPPADQTLQLRVTAVEPAGRDTAVFRLTRRDDGALPATEAGAHLTLCLVNGSRRPYSLLHAEPTPAEYAIAVRREPDGRGGSALIHAALHPGSTVAALPPRNDFALAEDAADTLLIGGGIGVSPLIAMAERLAALSRRYRLHAAFRSRADALLMRELTQLGGVSLHFDDEAGGLFPLAQAIAAAPRHAHLYCCGPSAMIDAFREAAEADGRAEERLHVEYFETAVEPAAAGSIVVELRRSGLTLTVPPGQSILDAVREAGVPAVSSCEEGMCGACEVRVLEGVPDHRDAVLTPQDRRLGKSMMICCSGALSDRLVLDL